jgi:hypothetical protein
MLAGIVGYILLFAAFIDRNRAPVAVGALALAVLLGLVSWLVCERTFTAIAWLALHAFLLWFLNATARKLPVVDDAPSDLQPASAASLVQPVAGIVCLCPGCRLLMTVPKGSQAVSCVCPRCKRQFRVNIQ